MTDWNLSEKIKHDDYNLEEAPNYVLLVEDVREFVKRLKKAFCQCPAFPERKQCPKCDFIDKLAGSKLC